MSFYIALAGMELTGHKVPEICLSLSLLGPRTKSPTSHNYGQSHFPILNETPTSGTQEGPYTQEEPNEHTDTVFDGQGSLDYWVACSCHRINKQQHKSQNYG